MQPCTPPWQNTRWVNGHGIFTVPDRHSNHSEQFDGQLSLSAPDTCPHRSFGASIRRGRSLALDHGLVYLHPSGAQNHPRCSATQVMWAANRLVVVRHPMSGTMSRVFRRLVGRIAADVDPPSGEPSGQPGILPLFADGQ